MALRPAHSGEESAGTAGQPALEAMIFDSGGASQRIQKIVWSNPLAEHGLNNLVRGLPLEATGYLSGLRTASESEFAGARK